VGSEVFCWDGSVVGRLLSLPSASEFVRFGDSFVLLVGLSGPDDRGSLSMVARVRSYVLGFIDAT
jgi:hypothetical protein